MNVTYNTGETSVDLRRMYNPDGSDLRKAQERMLEMLLYLDSVAKKIGVEYFIEGGTLLGAVRHGGFIPWDDDADIAMRRTDWKKLCTYLKQHPHPQFVLQDHTTDPHYYGAWAVLRDLKSEYIQDSAVHKLRKYRGLQVDLFPLEERPVQLFRRLSHIMTLVNIRKVIGKSDIISNVIWFLQFKVVNPFFRLMGRVLPCGKKGFVSYVYGHVDSRPLFLKENLFPTKEIAFEGHNLQGPHDPIRYCQGFFGDYESLPNKESRCKHHAKYIVRD